jgi:hypothetical protein
VLSPVLSNIYLSKLDTFAETVLIPQYTRGDRRKVNPEYRKLHYRLTQARREGDRAKAREYRTNSAGEYSAALPAAMPASRSRERYCPGG